VFINNRRVSNNSVKYNYYNIIIVIIIEVVVVVVVILVLVVVVILVLLLLVLLLLLLVVVVVLVVVSIMISCSSLLLRRPIARKIGLQYLSSTASHNNAFGNSVKDALKAGEKYGTLSLAVLAILGAVAGVSTTLTANNKKIASLEKAYYEKIASLEKLMDEKINSSVQKSVHVALENFLKYSYSNEYKDMREKHAKQSIVSKDDDISRDVSDDSKTKSKE